MKIALDPYMLRTVPLLELPRVVADEQLAGPADARRRQVRILR